MKKCMKGDRNGCGRMPYPGTLLEQPLKRLSNPMPKRYPVRYEFWNDGFLGTRTVSDSRDNLASMGLVQLGTE
jgi:hypothetical protein